MSSYTCNHTELSSLGNLVSVSHMSYLCLIWVIGQLVSGKASPMFVVYMQSVVKKWSTGFLISGRTKVTFYLVSPVFIANHGWQGILLSSLGSAVPALLPPIFLCLPSLLTGGMVRGAGKALTLCEHCSALAKTSLCHQNFIHKSKTAPCEVLWRKLTVSQKKPVL